MCDGITAQRNSKLLSSVSAPNPVIIMTANGGKNMLTIMSSMRYGRSRTVANIVPVVVVLRGVRRHW